MLAGDRPAELDRQRESSSAASSARRRRSGSSGRAGRWRGGCRRPAWPQLQPSSPWRAPISTVSSIASAQAVDRDTTMSSLSLPPRRAVTAERDAVAPAPQAGDRAGVGQRCDVTSASLGQRLAISVACAQRRLRRAVDLGDHHEAGRRAAARSGTRRRRSRQRAGVEELERGDSPPLARHARSAASAASASG